MIRKLERDFEKTFGYTYEELKTTMLPMAKTGAEPLAAMGVDTPLQYYQSNLNHYLITLNNYLLK